MFTGIIEEVAVIEGTEELAGARRLTVRSDLSTSVRVDQSISLNGACQTVVAHSETTFEVIAVEETLAKTTMSAWASGTRINVERAMLPTRRLDGHLLQGHVDATGHVSEVERKANSTLFRIRFDPSFAPYVIPTGSIAVDGVSLTTARIDDDSVTVSIIPYTFDHTNIASWKAGTRVNLEFDMIGKYVIRWMSVKDRPKSEISETFLRDHGF